MKNIKRFIKKIIETICEKLEKSVLSNKSLKCKVVFGPVRSRRLGIILGINNIRPDICSYNCIYCSSGNKTCCSICRNNCVSPYELHLSVKHKLSKLGEIKNRIEYIAFTGSGEPALDNELLREIVILRKFGYKIAVFTNASLILNEHIQENLKFADYISVKIDTVNPETWIKINRPHKRLRYDLILEGISQFSKKFSGTFSTETMLIKDINDNFKEIDSLGNYLNSLKRDKSFFMSPIFPPNESFAVCPDDDNIEYIKNLIKTKVKNSELLCCPDKEEITAMDDFENEFLGLLEIHPIRIDSVKSYIKNGEDTNKFNEMIEKQIIKEVEFKGKSYYAKSIVLNE